MKRIRNILFIGNLLFFPGVNAQTGLVVHWSFDTISNNQFMEHVSNQTGGTVYGCQSVTGKIGNALSFDGIDDYVRIPGDNMAPPVVLSGLSEGSISLWFKVEHIPQSNGIRPIFYYGNNNACNFFDAANKGLIIEVGHSPIHHRSKRLYFTIWSNGCTYPSFCYDSWNPIIEGQWYHFVAIVGTNFNTGYLNGQLMSDRVYNFGTNKTHEFLSDAIAHENLWIGKGHWNRNDMYFKGAIDEVKIFNRAIGQKEVELLYSEGSLGTSIHQSDNKKTVISIYPNPALGTIKLDIPLSFDKTLTIDVLNTNGVVVYQSLIFEFDKSDIIDLNHLPAGLYFITLKDDSSILNTVKLIIR